MKHHAYVYVGTAANQLPAAATQPGIDVEHMVLERFGINDARHLKTLAYRRPQAGPVQHIVITTQTIPLEAQNALLKLLEEPPATTIVHICIPRKDQLLPTVLSRVALIEATHDEVDLDEQTINFFHCSYQERLAHIEVAHKKKDTSFFNSLAVETQQYIAKTKLPPTVIRELLFAVAELPAPGASKKMLAEHIALTAPYHQ